MNIMDNCKIKINQILQLVTYQDKYVEKFDALSLSTLDLKECIIFDKNLPEFKGLQKLNKDITDILNEGYIAQQSFLSKSRNDLENCKIIRSNIMKLDEKDKFQIFDSNTITENQNPLDYYLAHQEFKASALKLYENINQNINAKLNSLISIKKVIFLYKSAIIEIATANNVSNAEMKLNFLISKKFDPIFQHRLFYILEDKEIIQEIESLWGELVYNDVGLKDLTTYDLNNRVLKKQSLEFDWTLYMKIGASIILLLWTISECFNNESSEKKVWKDPTFAIFMCFGDLILLLFMWALSMRVWKANGVDFIKLLGLEETEISTVNDPTHYVLKSVANSGIIYLTCFIIFNKLVRGAYSGYFDLALAHAIPVLMTVFFCYRILSPFEYKKKWLYMLWRVVAAPFYPVIFRDGYIGDLLTSLVRVTIPFVFSLLYVFLSILAWVTNDIKWAVSTSDSWWTHQPFFTLIIVPFLILSPLFIRFLQCLRRGVESGDRFPHFANALKYTSAMIVVLIGTFDPSVRKNEWWVFSFIFATLYQYTWDVFQDWGIIEIIGIKMDGNYLEFFESCTKAQFVFRTKRLYGSHWLYIAVMIFNLALRFAWTLTLFPSSTDENSSLYSLLIKHAGPFLAAAEIVRRMIWGFFRLEYEQILLTKKFYIDEDDYLIDDSHLDKMEVNVAHSEKNHQSFTNSPILNKSDWTSYLPHFVVEYIHSYDLSTPWSNKVRFLEAFCFLTVVLYIIFRVSLPALFN